MLALLLLAAASVAAEKTTVTVLATTDLHGNIYPVDYFTARPAARGLARIATLVRQARAGNPNSLLIDCGDTIQGSPLEYVYQSWVRTGKLPLGLTMPDQPLAHDPMMLAMNRLRYDAMTVGNHEFNFGLKNLNRARSDAEFPWLAANIAVAPGGSEKPFAPYLVKVVGGVKVAIIGVTTPSVPVWEKPENIGSYRFLPAPDAVRATLEELRRIHQPDVVVVAAHSGLDRDLRSGAAGHGEPGENVAWQIAGGVPGIDAVIFGHTHQDLAGYGLGKVLLVQPKNWGMSLARVDFTLEKTAGRWKVEMKDSRLIPVTADTPAGEDILALARPYHEAAERYLNTAVSQSTQTMSGRLGRVEDTALVDAIQAVQLHYAKADVSFTSLFNTRVSVPAGSVTVRQLAALYIYDNELYAIEGTGKMVKDALENAARYFISCEGAGCGKPSLVNSRVFGFNYDMAEGVEYEIDLTRPEGDRIRNLRFQGRALDPDRKLRIAVNNYRAAGSAGYSMFSGAKVVWRSMSEIRDLMIQYYSEGRKLPAEASRNWRIVPAAAQATLAREAAAEEKRAKLM